MLNHSEKENYVTYSNIMMTMMIIYAILDTYWELQFKKRKCENEVKATQNV